VVGAFVVLTIAQLVFNVTLGTTGNALSEASGTVILVVATVTVGLLVALLRQRIWASVLLFGFSTVAILRYAGSGRSGGSLVCNIASLALLFSPQIRESVRTSRPQGSIRQSPG